MRSITRFVTQRLKLKVNQEESAVDVPQRRSFLGFTFTGGGKQSGRRKIAPLALKRFKSRLRQLTRRSRGISMPSRVEKLAKYVRGWRSYFGFCETKSVLRDLDSWIRRRLRSVHWKQWKVFKNRREQLMKRGVRERLASETAWCAKGPWKMSHMPGVRIALNNQYFDSIGLPRLLGSLNIQRS